MFDIAKWTFIFWLNLPCNDSHFSQSWACPPCSWPPSSIRSPQALPRGRSPPPSCPTRTTSPGRRITAASCALTEARGRNSAAWWSSTTPCTRGRRPSTSRWRCQSAAAWECTTTPPRSTSWRTRTTVSPGSAAPVAAVQNKGLWPWFQLLNYSTGSQGRVHTCMFSMFFNVHTKWHEFCQIERLRIFLDDKYSMCE